jgi:hypothetical protein
MKFRTMARNGCFALAILITVAGLLTFWPRQTTPASAAGNRLLPSFKEQVGGQTFIWKQASPWYANASIRRVDTGKWVVREGRYTLGTIEVGVNEFYSDNKGDPGWSVDTTTSIHGVTIPHEITESAYPAEGRVQHESPWGFADSYYGPNNPSSFIENPTDGPFPNQLVEASGANAHPMYRNMQEQVGIQQQQYTALENLYRTGAQGNIIGGGGHATDGAMLVNQPALVFPASVYVLAAAGLTLAFSGAVVTQLCGHNLCGKHSTLWAIVGGIAAAMGLVMVTLSGYSTAGASVRAAQLAADKLTASTRSVASAERLVELGMRFASSRAGYGTPGDISAAMPLVRASSI